MNDEEREILILRLQKAMQKAIETGRMDRLKKLRLAMLKTLRTKT